MTTQALPGAGDCAPAPASSDARVISVIGFAHGVFTFFHLLLPPLFPWLMPAFGLSFIEIGATMTVFLSSPALARRWPGLPLTASGALKVLLAGISCFLLAGLGLSLATGSAALFAVAALAGLGNAGLSPADFTVLNRKVSPPRLGHAFSMHGLSATSAGRRRRSSLTGIASLAGWRVAAASAGLLAIPAMLLLWKHRALLDTDHRNPPESPPAPWHLRLLGDRAVCCASPFSSSPLPSAIQNYATPVLQKLYGLPLGVAAGGALHLPARRRRRHHRRQFRRPAAERTTASSRSCWPLPPCWPWCWRSPSMPGWGAIPLMAGISFFTGVARPSRDLLVRPRRHRPLPGGQPTGASTASSPGWTAGWPQRRWSSAAPWIMATTPPCWLASRCCCRGQRS